jgi:hypothetical protein
VRADANAFGSPASSFLKRPTDGSLRSEPPKRTTVLEAASDNASPRGKFLENCIEKNFHVFRDTLVCCENT